MKSLRIFIPLVLISFLLDGCYTQLVMRPSEYEGQNERVQTEDDGYYEDYEDTTEYYGEENYDDGNEYYYEDEYYEPNNYGSYYPYSRYYWGYYPSISIGFNWGWGYGYSYYNPYCWDPFYYPWCGTYYYYPSYYSYYPGYYYGYGHYYPYHGGYWSGNTKVYRERSKSGYRLRNNDGLRSSYTTRGNSGGRNNGIVSKTRTHGDVNLKTPTKIRTTDRSNDIRNKEVKRNNITEREKKNISIERNKNIRKNNSGKRTGVEKKKITPPKVIRRNDTRNTEKSRKEYKPNIKTERKSGAKEDRRYKSGNNKSPKKYSQPKKSSSPPKSYSPPKRNSSPPKSYNPPRNNTPRSSGNRSGGNRSGNSGNRSGNSGGKKR